MKAKEGWKWKFKVAKRLAAPKRRGFILLLLLLMQMVRPVYAASYTVATFAELQTAINSANASAEDDTITLSANITLTSTLPNIANMGSLTIDGGSSGFALDGANSYRILYINSGANVTLTNLKLQKGKGTGQGGGIYNNGGTLTVSNSTLSDNSATDYGGGIYNENGGTLVINRSTLSTNRTTKVNEGKGGGIYNNGTITILDSTLKENSAKWAGGAIYNNDGRFTVNNSTLSTNSAIWGGGIRNLNGVVVVSNSTLNTNSATFGGGISNKNTLTVVNSTLSSNSATYNGGGISNENTLTVVNSTLSSNSATYNGGGILNDTNKTANVYNTIIAHSLTGNNCSGTLATNSNNWFDDTSCGVAAKDDPLFVDYAGADKTVGTADDDLHLQLCSLAVDAGDNNYLVEATVGSDLNGDGDTLDTISTDRDGNSRIVNGVVDLGAYEQQTARQYGVLAFVDVATNGIEGNSSSTVVRPLGRSGAQAAAIAP